MRKRLRRRVTAAILLGVLGALLLAVISARNETWRRRAASLPLTARTYLHALRPTPVLPTPPPVNEESRARLLTHALITPTLAPPLIIVEAVTVSSTPVPAPTPVPSPSPTAAALTPVVDQVSLLGVQHAYQLWNNCGPATVAMNLSYYNVYRDQVEAASFLKPDEEDKNVSPEQLVAYARREGFAGTIRIGGTIEVLKRLLSNGYPVIVEDWIEPEDKGGIGHYRLFTGYDQATGQFTAQDSYYGPDRLLDVVAFDAGWRVFNRKYIVIYLPQDEARVRALLGDAAKDEQMLAHALRVAQTEAQTEPENAFSWFNLGSTYVEMGEYELAAHAYDEARRVGLPFRMFWYQVEPFKAYLGAGRYQEVVNLTAATLQSTGPHEELYYYQSLAYKELGDDTKADKLLTAAFEYNPNFVPDNEAGTLLRDKAGN